MGSTRREYVKHHIDRLHTPGALRLLDLELSGPDEIYEGIICEAAGGHTEGSMNVLVETAEGTACICGDIVYDIHNQVVEPWHTGLANEPQTTGNHAMRKREEKAAIKKALNRYFVLPRARLPGPGRRRPASSRASSTRCPVPESTSPSSRTRSPSRSQQSYLTASRSREPLLIAGLRSVSRDGLTERSMEWNGPRTSVSASRKRTSGTWRR